VPHQQGELTVNFKLTEADTEQGNVKADEEKYFILADTEPKMSEDELTIYFEFRPLTSEEKQETGNQRKQEKLNEKAAQQLEEQLKQHHTTYKLWEKDDKEQTLLLRKLNHYTRKNQYDFFIHKDLKGFLQRELDFYIKTELVNVNDLYVLESVTHFDRIKHNFKTIKVFKNIADTIIDFLAQIEEFQKKLWEKKKFVLNTEWVITIDRLVKYVGEEEATPLLKEVMQNNAQIEEWKELFGNENVPYITEEVQHLKANLHDWYKFPIDTKHFETNFKTRLLNLFSKYINVEENADGLVIHSDNYHGLNVMKNKFSKNVDCIHIDPPYNTETSGFLYKNMYSHSSWLTMMNNRIEESIDLFSEKSCIQVHIDENEYENLSKLFENFPTNDQGTIIWDKKNPVSGASKIPTQHEYIICHSFGEVKLKVKKKNAQSIIEKAKELKEERGYVDENVRKKFKEWLRQQKDFSEGEKAYSEIDDKGNIYQSVHMGAPEPRTDKKFFEPLIHPVTNRPCPVPKSGWSSTPEYMKNLQKNNLIVFGNDENTQPRRKYYLKNYLEGDLSSIIRFGGKGKTEANALNINFPYSHSSKFYKDLIWAYANEGNEVVLDYFAGSGTTYHAVQLLNSEDKGFRKTLAIEQGQYTFSTILPRIKKIAYTFDWKEGKPNNGSMNGLGIFFKYQRLEQYEESLENISFNVSEDAQQKALQFDDYIPKYFLEFETRNSQTLVNTDEMKNPWNYQLKVWDGYTYDTQQAVDLIETFNYLIGLHLQKYLTKDIHEYTYQFVYGHTNDNSHILVIWRNVKDWKKEDYEKDSEILQEELKNWTYDSLYLNDQAHLPKELSYQPIEEIFKNTMIP
jgi:adenine-specific DNA-methyltransferase